MSYPSYGIYIHNLSKPPKTDWINDFSEFVDENFYNSSDWFTIQEEYPFASEEYTNIDVRINYVFSPTTGQNMGDDWKILMFSNISKKVAYGSMFYFDNNYWIAVNAENIKNLTSTCIVRRCNNTMRWLDENGGLYTVPCVLGYEITENRNYASAMSAVVNPSGILEIISQLNWKTNKINPNKRFLFGNSNNWTAYKVYGGGINNFNNLETLDNSSAGLLKLTVGVDFVNMDTDDIVNGIADVRERVYTISISGATNGQVGTTSQLDATVYLNGVSVSRVVSWGSSNELVATVSSSGLVTFVSEGICDITATLTDNSTVYSSVSITSVLTPTSEYIIKVSPDNNYVLEGDTTVFDITLELNGVVQPDTFTFTLIPNSVPSDRYLFSSIDGNSFSIENIRKYMDGYISVKCDSGIHSKTLNIYLRGAW